MEPSEGKANQSDDMVDIIKWAASSTYLGVSYSSLCWQTWNWGYVTEGGTETVRNSIFLLDVYMNLQTRRVFPYFLHFFSLWHYTQKRKREPMKKSTQSLVPRGYPSSLIAIRYLSLIVYWKKYSGGSHRYPSVSIIRLVNLHAKYASNFSSLSACSWGRSWVRRYGDSHRGSNTCQRMVGLQL